MKTVVLIEHMHEAARQTFEAHGGYRVRTLPAAVTADEIKAAIADADGIGVRIASLPADVLSAAPNLRVVAKHGVGTDNIDIAHCTSRGIPVAVTADANKGSVVEHTMMMMLALAKKAFAMDRETRAGNFHVRSTPAGFGVDLKGRTVMVIGVGRIGTALIPVLRAFGMHVIACDPLLTPERAHALGCELAQDFRAVLPRADLLTVHVPLTPENRGLIGADELAALPHHAIVINCARGGIVDEHALVSALDAGEIMAAGTDVFDGEPPRRDHPFFAREDMILAPHTGGNTIECLERMATSTAENIIAGIEGRLPARMCFNPEVLD